MNQPADNRLPPITGKADAEALLMRIGATMDTLNTLLEAETTLLQAGKLLEASHKQPEKAELASCFVRDFMIFKMHSKTLLAHAPHMVQGLVERYEAFKDRLHLNMTVLETAKSLSESLVSEMAEIVARQDKPVAYGYDGRNRMAAAAAPSPVSLNRKF